MFLMQRYEGGCVILRHMLQKNLCVALFFVMLLNILYLLSGNNFKIDIVMVTNVYLDESGDLGWVLKKKKSCL